MATVAAPVRIGPADRGRSMTLDEFLEAEVEEGFRYELARGALEVTQVPGEDHGQIVWNLYRLIRRLRPSQTQASFAAAAAGLSISSCYPGWFPGGIPMWP